MNEPLERIRMALAESMSALLIPPEHIAAVVAIMRALSGGDALSMSTVAGLIDGSDLDAEALVQMLAQMGMLERDAGGDVIGMVISLQPTSHRLVVEGRTLYTWCAIDTLFVPAILSTTAHVESICPDSGRTMRLVVGPSGVLHMDPPDMRVSLVAPGITKGVDASCCGVAGLTGVQGGFCGNVHFFASDEAAASWLATHQGAVVVSVEEAFDLTRAIWTDPLLGRSGRLAGPADDLSPSS